MFSKPEHNLVDVKVGEVFLGKTFSTFDILYSTLFALHKYLTEYGTDKSLNISFNDNDTAFGIVQIEYDIYGWNRDESDNVRLTPLSNFEDEWNFMYELALHTVSSIRENWDSWTIHNTNYGVNADLEEEIFSLISKIESIEDNRFQERELGNLLFGHSYGKYSLCGGDREKYQNKLLELLDLGFDSYGYIQDGQLEQKYIKILESKDYINGYRPHLHYFDNGIFMLNPYYWGEAEDLQDYPNFIYYPKNIEVRFWKYPLRDAWSNKEVSYEEWCEIIDDCKRSLS